MPSNGTLWQKEISNSIGPMDINLRTKWTIFVVKYNSNDLTLFWRPQDQKGRVIKTNLHLGKLVRDNIIKVTILWGSYLALKASQVQNKNYINDSVPFDDDNK